MGRGNLSASQRCGFPGPADNLIGIGAPAFTNEKLGNLLLEFQRDLNHAEKEILSSVWKIIQTEKAQFPLCGNYRKPLKKFP
jgi:hypothetical protein